MLAELEARLCFQLHQWPKKNQSKGSKKVQVLYSTQEGACCVQFNFETNPELELLEYGLGSRSVCGCTTVTVASEGC